MYEQDEVYQGLIDRSFEEWCLEEIEKRLDAYEKTEQEVVDGNQSARQSRPEDTGENPKG